MSDTDFVQLEITHRLGKIDEVIFHRDRASLEHMVEICSLGTIFWSHRKGRPDPYNGWRSVANDPTSLKRRGNTPEPRSKAFGSFIDIIDANAKFDFAVDTQDWRIKQPFIKLPDGRRIMDRPLFTFNRLPELIGAVLWPLPGYHDLDCEEFLGNLDGHRVDWANKKNGFVWRGHLVGHNLIGKTHPRGAKRRLSALFRPDSHTPENYPNLLTLLNGFPRYRMVARYIDDPRANLGFMYRKDLPFETSPALQGMLQPRLTKAEMMGYKFILVMGGVDLATSFFWTMNSGSVPLVLDCPFESFGSCHFKPWEHYVPLKADLSDFEERWEWCQDNDAECRAISERAVEKCRYLARADLREATNRGVIEEVAARLRIMP